MRTLTPGRKLLGGWPILLVSTALAFAVGFSAARILWRAHGIAGERARVEEREEAARRQHDALQDSIDRAGDPAVTERAAKAGLNLRRSGEQVVVVQPRALPLVTTSTPSPWWEHIPWIGPLFQLMRR